MFQVNALTNKFMALRLVVLVLITSLALTACSGPAEREAKYLAKAEKYFADSNYQKAKVEIKNVLQINPKNSKARVLLGKVNFKEGEIRQAFGNFGDAAEEDPNQVDARVELAKIFLSVNKLDDAKRYIDEVIKLDPNNADALSMNAVLLFQDKNIEGAKAIAQQVLQSKPGFPQAISVLANAYRIDQPDLALKTIDEGLKLNPKNAGLRLLKIEVLNQMERFADIEVIYKELIKDNPTQLNFYDKLAAYYAVNKRNDEAEAIVKLAIENNPDDKDPILALIAFENRVKGPEKAEGTLKEYILKKPKMYLLKQALAQNHLSTGKVTEAKAIFNSVIQENPKGAESLSARVDLVKLAIAEKDKKTALKLLDEIFAIETSNTEGRIQSARIKLFDKQVKEAIADLRTALKNDARSIDAYRLLAQAQEMDGTDELALNSYFSALEINSEDIPSLFGAARLSLKAQKMEAGKKLIEQVIRLQPLNLEANLLMISVQLREKNYEAAEKIAQLMAGSESPQAKATGFNALGNVYSSQQKWSLAKDAYSKSLEVSPESFDPLSGKINAEVAEGHLTEAIAYAEAHVKKYPDAVKVKRLLVGLYTKAKKTDLAIALLESLIKTNPEDESLYEGLAGIYFQQNNAAKAESIYKEGLSRLPNSIGLHVFLGNLYSLQKNYAGAKVEYETAQVKAPQNEMIRNNLAILLINHFASPENIRKATELTQDFSKSKEPTYLDTLGWVQYFNGNYPQAISYLQQAISIKTNPEFHYHLGAVFKKNNQLVDAKRELSLAIKEGDAKYEWYEAAQQSLKELP